MTSSLVWSPTYEIDIGAHVFPTRKYRLVGGQGWGRRIRHGKLPSWMDVALIPVR